MAKNRPASEGMMAELHALLAKTMKKKLESKEFTASDLSVIRQFLKDNGIEALPENNEELKSLANSLPDLDDVDHENYTQQ